MLPLFSYPYLCARSVIVNVLPLFEGLNLDATRQDGVASLCVEGIPLDATRGANAIVAD